MGRAILGKHGAVGQVNSGVDDVWVGAKRLERFLSAFAIVECNSRGTGMADHGCEAANVADQLLAESDYLDSDKGCAGQQQREDAGRHDDRRLLMLQRGVFEAAE